ncbi:MAG: NAD-binding protein, partial [Gammaproteobacteria bacterium]|nr:NAD-binding protein [Gammaproteobacteria bacterium]
LIPGEVGQFMLIVTGISMVITPLVASASSHLIKRLEPSSTTASHEGNIEQIGGMEGHVVVAGFGRVGRILGRTLDADAIPYVAIDTDPNSVAAVREQGMPVYYGDASRLEMLRRAHLDKASALVVTMDNASAAEHVVKVVHAEWPHLAIVARARDAEHASRLLDCGAAEVIMETIEASLQLSGRILQLVGTPEEVSHRRIDAQREQELAAVRR